MKRLRSSCRDKGWPGTFQIVPKSRRVSGSSMHFGENSISCHGDGECFGGTDGRTSPGAKRFVESTNHLAPAASLPSNAKGHHLNTLAPSNCSSVSSFKK